jgi:uncharacterized membrane protein
MLVINQMHKMHKSHLCYPVRLSQLLLTACLVSLWLVYLGAVPTGTAGFGASIGTTGVI